MRAEPLLLGLLLAAVPAAAQDEGVQVRWKGLEEVRFSLAAPSGASELIVTPESDAIAEAWDTVLVRGRLPAGAKLRLQAARATPAPWRAMELHRYPSGQFWARAVLDKGVGPLRLRALSSGASGGAAEIDSVQVFSRDHLAPEPPSVPFRGLVLPDARRPPMIPRAGWNARPPREPWQPDPMPWRVTLHHAAFPAPATLEDSLETARFIQDFHVRGRGWNDIGYHFLVDPLGNIIEGRPEGALGAHTLRNNEGNVGIVLLGDFQKPLAKKGDAPTRAQLDAAAALGRYLVRRYGLAPASLKGHRDYKNTECPGDRGYAVLAELRRAFAEAAASPALARLRESAR